MNLIRLMTPRLLESWQYMGAESKKKAGVRFLHVGNRIIYSKHPSGGSIDMWAYDDNMLYLVLTEYGRWDDDSGYKMNLNPVPWMHLEAEGGDIITTQKEHTRYSIVEKCSTIQVLDVNGARSTFVDIGREARDPDITGVPIGGDVPGHLPVFAVVHEWDKFYTSPDRYRVAEEYIFVPGYGQVRWNRYDNEALTYQKTNNTVMDELDRVFTFSCDPRMTDPEFIFHINRPKPKKRDPWWKRLWDSIVRRF